MDEKTNAVEGKEVYKIGTIILLIGLMICSYPCAAGAEKNAPAVRGPMIEAIPALNIPFITNTGQIDDEVKYYARTFGGTLYVTKKGEMVYVLSGAGIERKPGTEREPEKRKDEKIILKERLLNPEKMEPRGVEKVETRINYFIGDRSKWRVDVPAFKRISLSGIYQGIDLSLSAYGKRLEKVFTVHPCGRAGDIRIGIEGASALRLNADGELEADLDGGDLTVRFSPPVAYQDMEGEKRAVHVAYELAGKTYGFRVGEYDRSRPLVIDPVLEYATYLGGSGEDVAYGIAVDEFENVYITGYTESANFPTINPFQATHANPGPNNPDVFVTKLDYSGQLSGLSTYYATYLGGDRDDIGYGIAVDHSGTAYITGYTESDDFPTMNAMQPNRAGQEDAFVTKLDENGQLGGVSTFSTFLGGGGDDRGRGIAVNRSGNTVYITGQTRSDLPTPFPTKNPIQTYQGNIDAFVTLLDMSGQTIYSTYLGGDNEDRGYGIAAEATGNTVYVTGRTESGPDSSPPYTNFPLMNAYDSNQSGFEAFVTKIDDSGKITTSTFSTYMGGGWWFFDCDDFGRAIAVDDLQNVYIVGDTACWNFHTMNAYQPNWAGDSDAFVTKLDASGRLTASTFSTYLGGSDNDYGYGVAVCCSGEVHITGYTESADFPVRNAYQKSHGGGTNDAFVTKLSDSGNAIYSTYYGGSQNDYGRGIAVHTGKVYFTGQTLSPNLPTTPKAYQRSLAGGYDAFVGKFMTETAGKHFYFGKAHNLED